MNEETLVLELVNRRYLYQLLKTLFGTEPTAALLEVTSGEASRASVEYIGGNTGFIQELSDGLARDARATVEALRDEFTRLLVGPAKLPAPPWGSYYASKDATLFGLETLAVRKAYLEQGFIPERYPSEADDHIALELDFMFILADKTLESFNDGQIDEAYGFAKVQNDFLQAHLLNWVPLFAADLQKEEGCMLYPHLAPLLVKVLEHDAAFLERFVPVEN